MDRGKERREKRREKWVVSRNQRQVLTLSSDHVWLIIENKGNPTIQEVRPVTDQMKSALHTLFSHNTASPDKDENSRSPRVPK